MIALRREGAVATIALDRPAARNAISGAGWNELARIARSVADDDCAAVVLRSDAPGVFSAGADLGEMAALATDEAARAQFRTTMRAAIDGVAAIPVPVIAAIDGGCYGAGVALMLACDVAVAGDGARFATTPAKLGIGYPGADVARLISRVGRGQASRMLFSAAPVDAGEAREIGLVDVRVPDAATAARDLALRIAANSVAALRLLKRTLADPAHAAADAEFDAAFGGADFAERLAAFRARPR